MTSADLHDSQRGEAMNQGDEEVCYADKASDSHRIATTMQHVKHLRFQL